jgi:hypothetical protein
MVLDSADAAAVGHAHHHRHPQLALRAVMKSGELGDDLVEGGEDEPVKLDLADRSVTPQREPDRGTDDPGLAQWGVHHTLLAEVLLQAVGDPEDPAELADVLAHQDDLGVGLHRSSQALIEALGQGDRLRSVGARHQCSSPGSSNTNDAW